MRILMLGGLLTAGLLLGTVSHAQSFESPFPLVANSQSNFSTCGLQQQTLVINDGEVLIYAPAVVYRVNQLRIGRNPPRLRPWWVTMEPTFAADLSLWVCLRKSGDVLDQCVDGSDDYGNGAPEHVTVPAVFGSYYVIVTGNFENLPPLCGDYVLTVSH